MPITYHIKKQEELIHTRCGGDVSFQEVLDHFTRLEQDPHRPQRLDVLLDLRDVTSTPTINQLQAVSAQIGRTRQSVDFGFCAIVVSQDLLFGLARMFEAFVEGKFTETRVFRSASGAEAWLASSRSRPPK
jgi:hypothetical protein